MNDEFDDALDDGLSAMRGIFNCLLLVSHALLWAFVIYILSTT
jgi:hypothetical protein